MTPEKIRGSNQPWDPTPEEIAAGCERIRAGWSAAETRKRAAWMWSAPVTVDQVAYDDEIPGEW